MAPRDKPLEHLTIGQLAPLLAKKKVSPVEVTTVLLGRIERLNPAWNAYLTVTAEQALQQARRAEAEITRGRYRGPLHGLPIALKDNIYTRGIRTTVGAKFLANFVPDFDAAVVERLLRAGAVLLGKTNLHEFAYGVTTENPHYGPTRNPWDPQRIPGGSSGGAAVAVAGGLAYAAIGTDTGGSIRIPAALCGIVGLKPTYGRVSCHGVFPLCPSLDHVGPLARSVQDVGLILQAIAGRDPHDDLSAAKPVPEYARAFRQPRGSRPLRDTRIGKPIDFFFERLEPAVAEAVDGAIRQLRKLGAEIREVATPSAAHVAEPGNTIALAEATRVHQQAGYFPANAPDYGEDVRKRLELGTEVRAVDYLAANEERKRLRGQFEALFDQVDVLVTPTLPIVAPRIGERLLRWGQEEEPVRTALLRYNRPANLTGLPAISIPCGLVEGLPVGMQLVGRAWDELDVLRVAHAFQQATRWHSLHPPGTSAT